MTGTHRPVSDFRHYFKQIYKSSIGSTKALKTLTSKLKSVGLTSSKSQQDSPANPPDRIFKAYVAYDVGILMFRVTCRG